MNGCFMTVNIFGYNVVVDSFSDVVKQLINTKKSKGLHRVVTLNPEMIVLAERNFITKTWLMKANTIVADGYGVKWASKVLGKGSVNIISGVDLVINLLQQKGLSFYFVGSSEDVIKKVVENSKRDYPNATIVGSAHGFFSEFDSPDVIKSILDAKPDVILVGMGFPKQEYFIQTLAQYCHSGVAIGVGGTFEVLAGVKSLAPSWVKARGWEWIYRAIQDPKRFFRWKYLVYYIIFTFQNFFSLEKSELKTKDF
ncbi:MAG: glycosyltransferase [Rickettsiales bacterium]|nr:glycosyltransferase [Rickettsiales bacterium]